MAELTEPTDAEDRAIIDAALDDPDNPPLTARDFAEMRRGATGRLVDPLAFARFRLDDLAAALEHVETRDRAAVAAVLVHIRAALAAAEAPAPAAE